MNPNQTIAQDDCLSDMSKKYLIIGGSTGIGLQLVKLLLSKNCEVIVAARNERELDGLDVTFISHDVLADDEFKIDAESLDGMAYCPGTINLKPFHRLSKEDFLNDFNINVLGCVHILQKVLPALKKSGNASVVLFSTVAVQQGMGFHSSIATSKGAIEGLTKSLAAELSPTIRVNCVAPSVTDTPLAERLLSSPEKIEASGKRHPLQRVGSAKEIANAAYFLLSDKSSWTTGQVLGVDGGMSTLRML